MDVDWSRTLLAGAITGAALALIMTADARNARQDGEPTAGLAPLLAAPAGLVLGLILANLLTG